MVPLIQKILCAITKIFHRKKVNLYPKHLIPTEKSQIILSTAFNEGQRLAKWVAPGIQLKNTDGKLNPSAVEIKRIPGFSTNCIPYSKKEDLFIQFKTEYKEKFNSPWVSGGKGELPPNDSFEIDPTRGIYYIPILQIHGFKEKYNNPPDKIYPKYEFELKVCHKPLVANYWHFEFQVFDNNGDLIDNMKTGWRKLICSSIRDRLQEIVKF